MAAAAAPTTRKQIRATMVTAFDRELSISGLIFHVTFPAIEAGNKA
jgi:hypothetical protein